MAMISFPVLFALREEHYTRKKGGVAFYLRKIESLENRRLEK